MQSWKSQPVQDNKLTTISDLIPHTIYSIKVLAFTGVGPGPLSEEVRVKTQQGGKLASYFGFFIHFQRPVINLFVYSTVLDLVLFSHV